MVRPLTKRKADGELYTRPSRIEGEIRTVSEISPEILQERLNVTKPGTSGYISSECLVYLIRGAIRSDDQDRLSTVLLMLLSRCKISLMRAVPTEMFPDAESIREEILGQFSEMLAEDGAGENPGRLDFYEIRFNLAFRRLYLDAIRKEEKHSRNTVPLPDATTEDDLEEYEDTLVRIPEILRDCETPESVACRDELIQAIKKLPPDEQKAIFLRHMGYKVESADPSEETIVTRCRCSGRTIRNRLNRAAATLRKFTKEAP